MTIVRFRVDENQTILLATKSEQWFDRALAMSRHDRPNPEQTPLWGAILCWTAILPEQRSEMASTASAMGATHKLDLTSDVTHLIVGDINTPKYKYVAKERQDIRVLHPSWLDAVREPWIKGGKTDVEALEEKHRLPTFFNLKICVTGFENAAERDNLMKLVRGGGAEYYGDLTKSITHLVAAVPKGKKYDHAGLWNIKVVSIEWIHESIARGMALDESLYDPRIPVEERGVGAVTKKETPPSHLGKRQRADEMAQELVDAGRRKLRRTASTKLGSQSQDLWADLGGDSRPATPTLPVAAVLTDAGADEMTTAAVVIDENETQCGLDAAEEQNEEDAPLLHPRTRSKAGMLDPGPPYTNQYVVHGFPEAIRDRITKVLTSNGAEVYHSPFARNRFFDCQPGMRQMEEDACVKYPRIETPGYDVELLTFLYPHNARITLTRAWAEIPEYPYLTHAQDLYVTEVWLEKCLHAKQYVDPTTHPLYEPFNTWSLDEDEATTFESLTICPTSFPGVDLLHFSKAVNATGATYNETLTKDTSVLVCNTDTPPNGQQEKIRYALQHGIPVVSQKWLWESMRKGKVLDFGEYELFDTSSMTRPVEPTAKPLNAPPPCADTTGKPTRTMSAPTARPKSSRSQGRVGQLHFSVEVRRDASVDRAQSSRPRSSKPNSSRTHHTSQPRALQDMSPNLSPNKQSSQKPGSGTTHPLVKHHPADHDGEESQLLFFQPSEHEEQTQQFDSMLTAGESDFVPTAPGPADADAPEPSDLDENPYPGNRETVNEALASLFAHKQRAALAAAEAGASRPSSADMNPPATLTRRQRPLGRAQSHSHHSTAVLSRAESFDVAGDGSVDQEMGLGMGKQQLYQPSQALGYEDPESLAVRERLGRKFGGVDAGSDAVGRGAESGGDRGGGERSFGGLDGADDGGRGMMRVQSIGRVTDVRRDPVEEKIARRAARRK